jgi:hypothetical protein
MCNCKPRLYTNSQQGFSLDKEVPIDSKCNGYFVQNVGNTLLVLNQYIVLQPNASFALGGNEGEIFTGRLDIQFKLPTPAPPVPSNGAVIVQKIYVE